MEELQEKWNNDIQYFLKKRILIKNIRSMASDVIFDIIVKEISSKGEYLLVEYCQSGNRSWVSYKETKSDWKILDELPNPNVITIYTLNKQLFGIEYD